MIVCRSCGAPLTRIFLDLGEQPLANAYLPSPDAPDPKFPLHARVCDECHLVQADAVVAPATIFGDYAFFSSYAKSWVEHCRLYVKEMLDRFAPRSVVEIASNDGCLLRQFPIREHGGPKILGVEPAANVAAVARQAGIPTLTKFFDTDTAEGVEPADLVVANNVLGHVPDLNDFVEALSRILNPEGVLTVEVPHVANLIGELEFDTIYHEHFSYFSLGAAETVFRRHNLRVFDVERLAVHGGSLRMFVCHRDASYGEDQRVRDVRYSEFQAGLYHPHVYDGFARRVAQRIVALNRFLAQAREEGKTVVGAGAPAKGNTLLNAANVGPQDVVFVTDTSPHKQGRFLPGSHIPILPPEALVARKPDFILVLAWNWFDEITASLAHAREWGAKFVTPIPELRVT